MLKLPEKWTSLLVLLIYKDEDKTRIAKELDRDRVVFHRACQKRQISCEITECLLAKE